MEISTMKIFYRGSQIAHLSLAGTYAALVEVVRCQQAMNTGTTSDPFTPAPPPSSDPFR